MAATNQNDPLTERIIGFAIEAHRHLGPGLLESAYEECLCHELSQDGLVFRRQVPLPVVYKSVRLDCGYRLDIVVENSVVIELKAVERLMPIHEATTNHLLEAERDPNRPLAKFQYTGAQRGNTAAHAVEPPHCLTASL
jgi:GxxExxY protein